MKHPRLLNWFLLSLLWGCVLSKECTNTPTRLSSHTFRYELLKSNNETWKEEMFSHYHLTPTDEDAWLNLLPRKMLREEDEFDWVMMYRKMKNQGPTKGDEGFLKEVPLEDVRLDPDSFHGRAQQTNLEYLLLLEADSLLWSFRKTAGLPTPGKPYGGWEAPNVELRGHFVGHYLSATAKMWASTHNGTLKEKMTEVVNGLYICQKELGNGYLSAFPSELFDRFEAIKPVWAPYYTIHKILQGLLDQYTFVGNKQAFDIIKWMVDYFYNRVQNVIRNYSIERHWLSLNEETGGMNDVLYQLYTITGDQKHSLLAHLFDKPCFLGILAIKADDISGFHANTHIPVVIGSQMRYEVTGDPLYKEISTFFLDIVNSSHSYATGGTSVSEFWGDPKRLASTLSTENEESCTTYNMLKVSRHLFRWTKDTAYADYYERALTNGVLPIQRGRDPGVMIYMLPLKHGSSKAVSYHGWGTKFDSFWCCYGTGIESFSKLGDSIYFEEEGAIPGIYIIQFVSSTFKWKSGGILLDLDVDPAVSWDPHLRVTVTITPLESEVKESTVNIRIPVWAYGDGAAVSVNGQGYSQMVPGTFLTIRQKWRPGDKISIELPVSLRTEAIKDDRPGYDSLQAFLYGPYLLAGLSTGEWDIDKNGGTSLTDLISSVPKEHNSYLKSFSQQSGDSSFVLAKINGSITMVNFPEPGTNSAAGATFRLISPTNNKTDDAKTIMLEPYDFPGAVLMHQGEDNSLTFGYSTAEEDEKSSVFNVVPGLDGNKGTVSLESDDLKGCYIYSDNKKSGSAGGGIKLSCNTSSSSSNDGFNEAVSFKMEDGISKYDPVSFVVKGKSRNFLLSPLLSLRDESYTVYFNFISKP